jgi:hypothetical protein
MHDLNLRLFYKTRFDVETRGGGDALWLVVTTVRAWIVNKWRRRGVAIPSDNPTWTAFKKGSEIVSEDGRVRLQSRAYLAGRKTEWACTVTEMEENDPYAPREWVCEIGFDDAGNGTGVFSLVLSWGDRPGYFGPCAPEPSPTIPGLVGRLARNPRLRCSVDGEPLALGPHRTGLADVEDLAALVLDPEREAPVVVMAPSVGAGAPAQPVDPEALAATLGPSAPVYACADAATMAAFNVALGLATWRLMPGMVRVYLGKPRPDEKGDHARHRFFTQDQIAALGEGEVCAILRRTLAADVNFYETMVRVPDVKRKIRQAVNEKRFKTLRASSEKAQEDAVELAAEIEEELDLALEELEAARSRVKELQEENFALSWSPARTRAQEKRGPAVNGLAAWPMKPPEIAEMFLTVYPDRLAFTDRGRKTLEECRTAPEVLWNALRDLAEIAWGLYRTPGIDVSRAFNDRSTFEYARGAGSMTRKDAGLMAAYKDVWEGREIDVQPHLKSGVKESEPKFLRLYFAYDEPSGKIVVSHVGRHLDTYGTRGLK